MKVRDHFRSLGLLFLGLLVVMLVVGCGDDNDRRSGRKSSSEPTEETSSATVDNERSWGSYRGDLTALNSEPEMPTLGETLGETAVKPDASATLQAGPVTVTIPAGVVDKPLVAKVSEIASGPAGPAEEKLQTLGQWDISIGEMQILPKPIRIDVKTDLPDEIAAHAGDKNFASRFGARYWDPYFKTWVNLPCSFDPATSTATIVTQHLCIVAVDWNMVTFDEAMTDHFKLEFYDSTIRDDSEMCDSAFRGRLSKPADQPYLVQAEAAAKKFDVPLYIAYAGLALERAYWIFKAEHLEPEPEAMHRYVPKFRREVYFLPVLGDSMYDKISSKLLIALAGTWRPDLVRCNTAHELMHAVQAQLLRNSMASQEYRRWWLEAQAEYASRLVWGDEVYVKMPSIDQQFLRKPLTLVNDTHEYQANTLIRYMVEKRKLCKFSELVKDTLDLGFMQAVAEQTLVVAYAADKAKTIITWENETGYGNMMDQITTFKPIGEFCKSKGVQFADVYRDFAAYMLFDANCRWLLHATDPARSLVELRGILAAAHQTETLELDEREAIVTMSARNEGTCDYVAILIEHTSDEIASGRKKTVEVVLEGDAFSGIGGTTDLYLLKDSLRQVGIKPIPTSGNAARRRVVVGPKDTLAVLVTNTGMTGDRKVTVRVRHVPSVTIEPAAITDGVAKDEIKLKATAADIPPEHTSVRFEWVFEDATEFNSEETVTIDSSGAAESKRKLIFLDEKDYKLEVRVAAIDGRKRLAARQCPIHIGKALPEISFRADELSIIYGADEFIKAEPRNLDLTILYRYRWTFDGKTSKSYFPEFRIRHEKEGKFPLKVELIGAGGKAVAEANTVLDVVKTDADWIIENNVKYDKSGKNIGEFLAKKYQVRKGTRIKHGLYFEAYLHGDSDGVKNVGKQWKICARYEDNKLVWYKKYGVKGSLQHSYQLDDKGRKDGLEIKATWIDSEDVLIVSRYSHGVIRRKETRLQKNQQVWRLELYDAKGLKLLYQGYDRRTGTLISKVPYRSGKTHGPCSTWHADGKQKMTGQYQDGKRVGHWKEWYYTGKMRSEMFFGGDGKQTREIRYRDGEPDEEITWDAAGKRTSRSLRTNP